MNDFKIYATRLLRKTAVESLPEKLWTRHGSTRYLWNETELSAAVNYVKDGQGTMAAFGQNANPPTPAIAGPKRQDLGHSSTETRKIENRPLTDVRGFGSNSNPTVKLSEPRP